MTIDAKELREAIAWIDRDRGWSNHILLLREAASAYAASLPREVEVEAWTVLQADGAVLHFEQESTAIVVARSYPGSQVVRLTGTALLPPRDKD